MNFHSINFKETINTKKGAWSKSMVNDLDIQTENDKTHMHLNFNLILISSKRSCRYNSYWALGSMVLNTTFNNIISVISWRSCSFIGELRKRSTQRKPQTCRKSHTNFITQCIEYTSPWTGFELTTLVVVVWTDCSCSCKSSYHTITTTTVPNSYESVGPWWLLD